MTRPSNQEIEQYYFERFRSHYSVPDGEIEYTDKPDVIIRGSKVVGIEITNFYLTSGADPASEQVQRNRRLQILARAQELHLSAKGKNIELSVNFEPTQPILAIEHVARALAELAKEIENNSPGVVNPTIFKHIPELRFVYNNSREYTDSQWRPVQGYSVPSLSVNRLRDVVKEKSKKAEEYQPCDEYWLLAVVDFIDPSQDQEIEWPMEERLGKSSFKRVILYKPQFEHVVEVVQ
jgi:hypothetical protein